MKGWPKSSRGAVTGVEKRAAAWLVELRNKVVRLDGKVFGVQQPALGPFQRRLQEIGGIAPLGVFGHQHGELSNSGGRPGPRVRRGLIR